MILAIVLLTLFAVILPVFIKLYRINSKASLIAIFVVMLIFSGIICVAKPLMHKPFSIDIIEYFIKINDDGSMTTTKKVTKTVIKDKNQQEENEK